jgi:hypothetical protein
LLGRDLSQSPDDPEVRLASEDCAEQVGVEAVGDQSTSGTTRSFDVRLVS